MQNYPDYLHSLGCLGYLVDSFEQCNDLTVRFVGLQVIGQTFPDLIQPTGGMFEVIPTLLVSICFGQVRFLAS